MGLVSPLPRPPATVSPPEQSGERRKVLLTFRWEDTLPAEETHSAPAGPSSRSTPPVCDRGAAEPAKAQRRHASLSVVRQLARSRAETHQVCL